MGFHTMAVVMFSTEVRPEVNAGKPKCKLKSCEEDEGQNENKNA